MSEESLEQRVRAALEDIRPALQMDGGDVEFVELDGDAVKVRLIGACGGCPMATMTLVGFVQERLCQRVPEVKQVVRV
ncbi:MAG TPA: NifU family protein [Thermoanaerobaculaceae bacterium]|nr:NifU family protein [Thermoanaerobaculaceae bacterium]HRS17048.1 NifU family protein [Thermoanaerobaculaceae bacterium]